MKKSLLFLLLALLALAPRAQQFFYIQPGTAAEPTLRQQLLGRAQFISEVPCSSDYTILSASEAGTSPGVTTLSILVVDTATRRTLFETREDYPAAWLGVRPPVRLVLAFSTLVEKNMDQILLRIRQARFGGMATPHWIKKDKT